MTELFWRVETQDGRGVYSAICEEDLTVYREMMDAYWQHPGPYDDRTLQWPTVSLYSAMQASGFSNKAFHYGFASVEDARRWFHKGVAFDWLVRCHLRFHLVAIPGREFMEIIKAGHQAAGVTGRPFRELTRAQFPLPHLHTAPSGALEAQARSFLFAKG